MQVVDVILTDNLAHHIKDQDLASLRYQIWDSHNIPNFNHNLSCNPNLSPNLKYHNRKDGCIQVLPLTHRLFILVNPITLQAIHILHLCDGRREQWGVQKVHVQSSWFSICSVNTPPLWQHSP